MTWILTAVYFLCYVPVIWVGFLLYAKSLIYLGKKGFFAKNIIGFIVYIFFACLLISPLFIAFTMIDSWRMEFKTNNFYMIYFMVCFLLVPFPGGIYFKNKYLSNLKRLGYFSSRYSNN
jgi:uncharacterized SAM-binding protein YcdF (DUF218 family)